MAFEGFQGSFLLFSCFDTPSRCQKPDRLSPFGQTMMAYCENRKGSCFSLETSAPGPKPLIRELNMRPRGALTHSIKLSFLKEYGRCWKVVIPPQENSSFDIPSFGIHFSLVFSTLAPSMCTLSRWIHISDHSLKKRSLRRVEVFDGRQASLLSYKIVPNRTEIFRK